MTVGININLEELEAWLEKTEALPQHTEFEAVVAMQKAVAEIERQVVPRTPVNTGQLRAAWTQGRVTRGRGIVRGEVLNLKEYAIVIEKGRSPNRTAPPVDAIQYWVTRKFGVQGKEAKGLAFYIAQRIGKHGFKTIPKGKKMLEEGFEAAEPTVRRIFNEVPGKVFNRLK